MELPLLMFQVITCSNNNRNSCFKDFTSWSFLFKVLKTALVVEPNQCVNRQQFNSGNVLINTNASRYNTDYILFPYAVRQEQ